MNVYKRKKINLFEFLPLIIITIFIIYFSVSINTEHSKLKEWIKKWSQEILENNEKIESKEIYKRLEKYWYRLSVVENIISYKDSVVRWFKFLLDLKKSVPNNSTITSFWYSNETGVVTIQLVSPSEERLIQTMKQIEDFEWLYWIDFNTISKEKISFLWDKRQYNWYSTTITSFIDDKYLEKKYEDISKYKRIKYDIWDSENVMDVTNLDFDNKLLWTWSLLEDKEEILSWALED